MSETLQNTNTTTAAASDEAILEVIERLALDAGRAVMEVFHSEIKVTDKADASPVTQADRAAERVILEGLRSAFPDVPCVAEEEVAEGIVPPELGQIFFLVDPLDGTKEFINRNGEFTVNIALIENGEAVLGVVYVPVQDTLYVGGVGIGAFKELNGTSEAIQVRPLARSRTLNVVGSRRHGAEELDALLQTKIGRAHV